MKTFLLFSALFSIGLYAQDAAERQIIFYNSEISGLIQNNSEEISQQNDLKAQIKTSTLEAFAGAGISAVGIFLIKQKEGKILLASGGLLGVKGFFDMPSKQDKDAIRAKTWEVIHKLHQSDSFTRLDSRFASLGGYSPAVSRLKVHLLDDIVSGMNLSVSAKRRCAQFEGYRKIELDGAKVNPISKEECEQVVLASLAEPKDEGTPHASAPSPNPGTHGEKTP